MTRLVERSGLRVAELLCRFIEERALPGTGIAAEDFWRGAAAVLAQFSPENRQLLEWRNRLQADIDAWHIARRGQPIDAASYQAFLRRIGYLLDEPPPFQARTEHVDEEIAHLAGPQLVVPVLNRRFLINAVNARWGSLYDALYVSDALPHLPEERRGSFDLSRGRRVVEYAKALLDEFVPLTQGKHAEVRSWRAADGSLTAVLAGGVTAVPDTATGVRFAGYRGDPEQPAGLLFRHHGLHIELQFDRSRPIGQDDPSGLSDVLLEAALTTIVDLEDSIAAVDAEDKVAAYDNWLGLMRGELEASFERGGKPVTRALNPERQWLAPSGQPFALNGRALLFVRNVGHLMTTPALLLADGAEAPEGILDAIVTSLIAMHDLRARGRPTNSRTGSVYIVKPKLHGPEETAFTDRLLAAVEDMLSLSRYTLKIGVMDEERRTSANLAACIAAVRDRIVFINTGFLDRTGDEIHTSMQAGAMVGKTQMKTTRWLAAYEQRNVSIGLACGLSGRAQIGKGMWAAPDRMAAMLAEKFVHPHAGATTAWVPSPVAAILHALHYHRVDAFARQREIATQAAPPLDALLDIPLRRGPVPDTAAVLREVDNNVQGILGYVVRWIDQGVGCSKVPDIQDINLMEDRATLRISSQHLANWLLHGVCSASQVEDSLRRMATRVDAQNAGDPLYRPMSADPQASLAFQAAHALIFEGLLQPNGYTEPLLHAFRQRAKQRETAAGGTLTGPAGDR
ncbi:MAG: malate synthase G [Steroidobacteraceae bacterium]